MDQNQKIWNPYFCPIMFEWSKKPSHATVLLIHYTVWSFYLFAISNTIPRPIFPVFFFFLHLRVDDISRRTNLWDGSPGNQRLRDVIKMCVSVFLSVCVCLFVCLSVCVSLWVILTDIPHGHTLDLQEAYPLSNVQKLSFVKISFFSPEFSCF